MTDTMQAQNAGIAFTSAEPAAGLSFAEFEMMLRNVLGSAFGVALRMTGNRHDAEDLVQEASLAAFRGASTFRAGSNFKAWFYKILMNCFYAGHRKFRPTTSLQDVEDSYAMFFYDHAKEKGLLQASDPAQLTIDRLTSEHIANALASLPDEYRLACTMYFMDDLSYEQIADMLGVPLGTVRSRLHRGRRMLQKRLWQLAVDQGIVPGAGTNTETGEVP